MPYPKLIAHTGCEGTKENTLESCEAGMNAGALVIEVDVRATKDQVAVLQHDEEPSVSRFLYSELVEAGREPETLKRILNRFAGLPVSFNLDLKTEEAAVAAAADLSAVAVQGQIWFTGATGRLAHSEYAGQVIWNLAHELAGLDEASYRLQAEALCGHAEDAGFGGLNLHYSCCRPYLVEQAHKHGLQVWIYTLPYDPDLFHTYTEMGVDAVTVYEVRKFKALEPVTFKDTRT